MTITEALQAGKEHHQAGRLPDAEALYRQILQTDPCHAQALHLLGLVAHQTGNLQAAIALIRQAIAQDPTVTEFHFNLAIVQNNLGNALKEQGQSAEAIACYRQALALNPQYANAHYNLANALRDQGQPDEAAASYRQALAINPTLADAHINLGNVLKDQALLADAVGCYQHALQLRPDYAEGYNNLASVLHVLGKLDEAVFCFRKAIELKPDYAFAYNNLGNALKDQGLVAEAIECFAQAVANDPDFAPAHSNLLYTLHYSPTYDTRTIFEEHKRWQERHVAPLAKFIKPHANDKSPDRRLRIGYVSPDFRAHAVGRGVWPLLRHHDHEQFEIMLYGQVVKADAMTEQIRRSADQWCPIAGWSDDQLADRIRADKIDILVDLTLHMADNRMLVFARKPAPVQVTIIGYPGTTGLDAMDYRLTDPYLDPPGLFDEWYAEESIRLPDTWGCYDPPNNEQPPVGTLPALAKGFITFGCLNNFCKVNGGVLELWARVLHAVEGSRLLLHSPKGNHRQRTLDFLYKQGIAAGRVEFSSAKPLPEYLAMYHQVDIGLDTFPYNGHTTSMDSFWMGVPIITLVGHTVMGRAGLCQLMNLGLPELIAETPDQFVHNAVRLAGDKQYLAQLRASLRERMRQSPLMNAPLYARNVEAAYRAMWQRWCSSGLHS